MVDIFVKALKTMFALFKWPLYFLLAVFAFFYLAVMFWILVGYIKGKRIRRGSVRRIKKRSALLKILYDAPRQYAADMFNMKPDFFRPQGLIIFTGRQGNGKTSALMQYAIDLLDTYPKAKCISNTKFKYQNEQLKHWKQLVNYKNAHRGVIVIMDELQNWFGSNQSRNFPPEMLGVITQNRKNRRVILGTAQNFYLLAKAIRSQCTEIRECVTLAGVVTIVIKREPILKEDGDVKELKFRGMYFFVHSPRLRDSYDTYAVVEALGKSGFQENPNIRDEQPNVIVNVSK